MDDKIKAALLGDAAAAAECTAARIAIPCPFCGGAAKLCTGYESEYVICTQCGARTATAVGDYYDEGCMDGAYVMPHWNRRVRVRVSEDNPPLTLEELCEMIGEPVWAQSPGIPEYGRWAIVAGVDTQDGEQTLYCQGDYTCRDYGKTWLAYRRRLEAGET